MKLTILCLLASTLPALAREATQAEKAAALPTVAEQRNNALDGVALCSGDLTAAITQIAALRAALETAKAELAKQKDGPQ